MNEKGRECVGEMGRLRKSQRPVPAVLKSSHAMSGLLPQSKPTLDPRHETLRERYLKLKTSRSGK
jgi:hypothetical protein